MVSLELVLWSPPAYNSQAPYTWLSLFHAQRLLLKATVSQHERQLPKCSSTNSWNSYLLQLKSEEAPERHQKQFLGPLGEVFKWSSVTITGSTLAGKDSLTPGDIPLWGPALPTSFSQAPQNSVQPNSRQAFLCCWWDVARPSVAGVIKTNNK